MVFYFTATGNSLFVAKKLDDNPISIPQTQSGSVFEDEYIGIVSPVYCGEIPKIVLNFLKNSKFKADYLYMILTYGKDDSDSAEFTYRQCKEFGLSFDFITTIKMVDNYLPAFDMNEEKKIDKKIEERLSEILLDLENKKRGISPATEAGRKLHKQVAVMNRLLPSLNNGSALKVTEKCTGCGICEKVCPIGNFTVTDKTARRTSKKCEFCLACIQNCPNGAIALKKEPRLKRFELNAVF
ncbi:MAG: EFR1 family ferrodoxin [Clostridia bacterium]|nr:EFR1 family ferrodoxin [Clostridia bacterium]